MSFVENNADNRKTLPATTKANGDVTFDVQNTIFLFIFFRIRSAYFSVYLCTILKTYIQLGSKFSGEMFVFHVTFLFLQSHFHVIFCRLNCQISLLSEFYLNYF